MSAALAIPAMTALDLTRAGVEFRRDAHNTIVGLRGPKSLCEEAAQEITRRAARMRDVIPTIDAVLPLLVIAARAPEARSGQCSSCADPMADHRSGQCELCEAALRKVLQALGRLP